VRSSTPLCSHTYAATAETSEHQVNTVCMKLSLSSPSCRTSDRSLCHCEGHEGLPRIEGLYVSHDYFLSFPA
jgi:hypothetical protein